MNLRDAKYFIFIGFTLLILIGIHSCLTPKNSIVKQDNSEIELSLVLMDSIAFFEKHHNVMDKSNASYDKVINFIVRIKDRPKFKNLPDNILLCKNIESVNLSFIEDLDLEPIISKLSKLKKLEELSLVLCNLDSLPSNIGLLENLKTLNIRGNCLKKLPLTLSKLEQLESLTISLNFKLDLSQSFTVLENCKLLKKLSIEDLGLISLDKKIGKLTQLEFLDLDRNRLKKLPCELMNLENLDALSLYDNNLDSLILPKCFKALKKIGSRAVSFYNIEGEPMVKRGKAMYNYGPTYSLPRCGKND